MRIDLQTIKENGQNYKFDPQSDETKGFFVDLIGKADFLIDLVIKPLGNTYQLSGEIMAESQEVCSLCGEEISVPFKARINEIVVLEKKRPRNTQVSQSQQTFNPNDPSVIYINEPILEINEILHELMAAAMVAFPVCQDNQACEERQNVWRSKQEAEDLEEEQEKPDGHPAFAALKGVKVPH